MSEENKCPKCGAEASAEGPTGSVSFRCRSIVLIDGTLILESKDCLRSQLSKAVEALKPFDEKLKADVQRLRTSAEPFAKIAKWFGDSLPDTETLVRGTAEYRLTLGHFRALARALEETK